MPAYSLTASYSGPYAVAEGDILQNAGGGKILVVKAPSTPTTDSDALELPRDFDVIRVRAAGNIYARAADGSAWLKVVRAI